MISVILKDGCRNGECDRSIERCREIASILSTASSLGGAPLEHQQVPLLTVVRDGLGSDWQVTATDEQREPIVTGDRERLLTMFRLIAELFAGYVVSEQQSLPMGTAMVATLENSVVVEFAPSKHLGVSNSLLLHSFTELFLQHLNLDSPLPPTD